jgi:hypothetical protein
MMDAVFAAILRLRLDRRWDGRSDVARLDNHLRRDIGLPPRDRLPLPYDIRS